MARAYNQAQKFGAEMAIPDEVTSLAAQDSADGSFTLNLHTGERARARSVVVATGARYRRLHVDNLDTFESSSVHYWASPIEAKLCANQEVALVGAGNSAGQAAVYLASQGIKVWMLVRRTDLAETMSRYLVDRIHALANVEVVTGATVSGLEGHDGMLQAVRWRLGTTGQYVQSRHRGGNSATGPRREMRVRVPHTGEEPRLRFHGVRAQVKRRLVVYGSRRTRPSDDNRLEPISKSSEEDNEAGELDKAEEVLSVVLPADEDATLPLYPGEEALDEPAPLVTA